MNPNEIRFQTGSILEEEIPKLAEFIVEIREGSVLAPPYMTKEKIRKQLRKSVESEEYTQIIARDDHGHVMGFMSIFTGFESMAFISSWNPIVVVNENETSIAIRLVEKAKELAVKRNIDRLEVVFPDITKDHRKVLAKFIDVYTHAGFRLASEEIKMELNLELNPPDVPEIPQEVKICKLSDISNDEIKECFDGSFKNSRDRLFLSMNEEQQEISFNYWFNRERDFNEQASLLILRDMSVIGYSIVRPDDDVMSIGPFGIIPSEQRKGLGKLLLSLSLRELHKQGISHLKVEVDKDNITARKIYEKVGFKETTSQIYYYWRSVSDF
ncbi:MAG: hypothetical protein BAJATHORv1_10038 [Candidatus Thorarchaeota archaeon]|nr:MAG: hypothetical protein BAJATHORv1_10038 [Candidatus Thorarchaeota archaeon]